MNAVLRSVSSSRGFAPISCRAANSDVVIQTEEEILFKYIGESLPPDVCALPRASVA